MLSRSVDVPRKGGKKAIVCVFVCVFAPKTFAWNLQSREGYLAQNLAVLEEGQHKCLTSRTSSV